MDWWYQARFGMFIHFGSYSHLGRGEWAFDSGWSKSDYRHPHHRAGPRRWLTGPPRVP
jgi:hypothetical protein